jgi:hypothetical protein
MSATRELLLRDARRTVSARCSTYSQVHRPPRKTSKKNLKFCGDVLVEGLVCVHRMQPWQKVAAAPPPARTGRAYRPGPCRPAPPLVQLLLLRGSGGRQSQIGFQSLSSRAMSSYLLRVRVVLATGGSGRPPERSVNTSRQSIGTA